MTMAEKKMNSIQKEIEKLEKSLDRYKGLLEKKIAKCEKLSCNWTNEEYFYRRDADEVTQEQWSAWFDKRLAEGNVEDTQRRLENAAKRFEKAVAEYEKIAEKEAQNEAIDAKELAWMEALQESEEKYYKWLEQFKKECAEDGIIIEKADRWHVLGNTVSGKQFVLYLNDGWTKRSLHSYTLRVNGTVLFTSGLFSTCYRYLINR